MTYAVSFSRKAQKGLAALPGGAYERMRDAIAELARSPRPVGSKKLKGREGWRLRSGDYRTIYEIDDRLGTVTILQVGHRREVYR